MKIFKELKKLGYKHYTEYTVEELDALELNNSHRIMEQALVLKWFREKYNLNCYIDRGGVKGIYNAFVGGSEHGFLYGNNGNSPSEFTYEEAELECLVKLIEIVKEKL